MKWALVERGRIRKALSVFFNEPNCEKALDRLTNRTGCEPIQVQNTLSRGVDVRKHLTGRGRRFQLQVTGLHEHVGL